MLEAFDRDFLRAVQGDQPERRQYPSLIGGEVLHKCRYLKSFPQSLNVVQHLRDGGLKARDITQLHRIGSAILQTQGVKASTSRLAFARRTGVAPIRPQPPTPPSHRPQSSHVSI